MTKKILSVILALTMCLSLFGAVSVSAATEGNLKYFVSDLLGYTEVSALNTAISGPIEVPAMLGGYPVTEVDSQGFRDCTLITAITLPENLTHIRSYAFYGCSGLKSAILPSTLEHIEGYAFFNCTSLAKITLPGSVKELGTCAFRYCSSLKGMTIPASITTIPDYAFDGCTSLKTVTLGEDITSIGFCAFRDCETLETVYYKGSPSQFEEIYIENNNEPLLNANIVCEKEDVVIPETPADYIYTVSDGKATLTSARTWAMEGYVTIPDTLGGYPVVAIGDEAFINGTNITGIAMPDTVKTIGNKAFAYCSSLATITIPDGVESIGSNAFDSCMALYNISLPDSVTSLGDYAFYSCSGLNYITLSENITSIGTAVFGECSNLIAVDIPDGVTSIGEAAFFTCSALKEITIPESVSSIGTSAFALCNSLQSVSYGGTREDFNKITIGDGNEPLLECSISYADPDYLTYRISYREARITDVDTSVSGDIIIPDTLGGYPVVALEGNAFDNCNNITSITIPSSVTSIGTAEFTYCSSLTDIYVEEGNNWFFSVGGVLFKEASGSTSLMCYPSGKTQTSYTIPDSTEIIDGYAFKTNHLTTLNLNKDLRYFGGYFFCSNLETITVESGNENFKAVDGVLFSADGSTLYYYPAKKTGTSYTVPEGVSYITQYAFQSNTLLENVVLPQNLETMGGNAFENCTSLKTITVPVSLFEIDYHVFRGCSSLETVYYEGTEEDFSSLWIYGDNSYFENANIVYNYKYGTTPEEPDDSAYYTYTVTNNKATITAVDTAISSTVVIPETLGGYPVVAIGNLAFVDCSNVTSVTIPEGITYIGERAFKDCRRLTTVTIPEGVTAIKSGTFINCGNLNSVTLPDGLISIENNAFYSCGSLTSINIPDSVTFIDQRAFDYCTNLTAINISTQNGAYTFENGVLFNKNKTQLIRYMDSKKDTSYTIPSSVTIIGKEAFASHETLTSVTIPGSVTIIEEGAFSSCRLNSLEIPNSVTSVSNNAFEGCSSLKSVTIPGSITAIPDGMFGGCSSLETVTISNGITAIGKSAFANCYKLETVTIPNTVTIINNNAFASCFHLYKITIPDSVTTINTKAFSYCTLLSEINIPKKVTFIGYGAFEECRELQTVYYDGSEAEFAAIELQSCNTPFVDAEKIFVKSATFDGYSIKLTDIEEGNLLILVLYSGKRMVDMQPAEFKSESINFTSTKSYDTAKILVWEDLDTCIPVQEAIILTEQ